MKPKLIAVVGQTATGKSALAVELALRYGGEVISADSRQVYRGLDIGTGKITKEEMRAILHHLLDVADPSKRFSVAEFKQQAEQAIEDIFSRDKLPILCGGTGFYIESIVDGVVLPDVPENKQLRAELSSLSAAELAERLKRLDPNRFETIDQRNKIRLIRAIEVAEHLGNVPKPKSNPQYEVLQIGLEFRDEELKKRIHKRLVDRIGKGMIEEAKKLHENGLSYERMNELGLEYRYLAEYLQDIISKEELIKILNTKIWQYARRQKTWFKRDERIHWIKPNETEKAFKLVREFYEQ